MEYGMALQYRYTACDDKNKGTDNYHLFVLRTFKNSIRLFKVVN